MSGAGIRPAQAAGAKDGAAEAIHIENLHKKFGPLHVLKGVSLSARDGDVVAIIGGSRFRQVDPAALHQLPGEPDQRHHPRQWRGDQAEGRQPRQHRAGRPPPDRADALQARHGVPELQSVEPHDADRERHRGSGPCARRQAGRGDRRGREAARPGRTRREARRLSGLPVRRPAAARARSPGRSPSSRASCCSTSRPRRSTPNWSARC